VGLNKMADISSNLISLKSQIPSSVRLVAVSKTKSVIDIMEAYSAGQKCFGENRVQELLNKKDLLPRDIEWHLIGHLQRNKVKFIVPFISMIQSVDSFKLLTTINSEASKINRVVDCLLQIHIAKEETKFGFSIEELKEMIESTDFMNLRFVRVCGVMGMATLTSDSGQIHREFSSLADCYNDIKNRYFSTNPEFSEISMGMSGDYEIALRDGSTIVRIGSRLFGERNKN
jgi:pyridoxal phosphate enzyme (YggS family)